MLAAVLLLGNVAFVDGVGMEVEVYGDAELNAVAGLLGVSPQSLFRGLTSRTHNTLGQVVKSFCDANIVRILLRYYLFLFVLAVYPFNIFF